MPGDNERFELLMSGIGRLPIVKCMYKALLLFDALLDIYWYDQEKTALRKLSM